MLRTVFPFALVLFLFLGLFSASAFAAEACGPDGEIQFLCGMTNPEDLYPVPNTPWVIASGRVSAVEGPIYAVNTWDYSIQEIFPQGAAAAEHDTNTYRDCPGPNSSSFQPHGLTLREGAAGVHTLYVVGHGEREAIEVFNLNSRSSIPSLKWIGCIVAPQGTARINSITALPGGSIAATNFDTSGGELWEWHPASGWVEVPGSQMPGPNGLISSADGQWLYVGGWSDQALVRLSRGQDSLQIASADVGFNVDNVRWGSNGNIVVAGHVTRCADSSPCELAVARVAKVNPTTLHVQQLVNFKGNDYFKLGTVAIEVGDEIWVGGIRGSLGIARFQQ
jgi:hypothetical protein